jgi:hypothetical protein
MNKIVTDRLAIIVSVVLASGALLLSACAAEPEPKPEPKPVAVVEKPEPVVEEPVEPSASFEVASISEHGDKRDLVKVLEKELPALNDCYLKQLQKEPGVAGDVRFELNISPMGRVDGVIVRGGTLDEDDLEGCTEQVFKSVAVPELKSGKDATAHVVMTYVAG